MFVEIPFGVSGKIFRGVMPFSSYDYSHEMWEQFIKEQIDVVVILVEEHEYLYHTQKDLKRMYQSQNMEVIHVPIEDFRIPINMEAYDDSIDMVLTKANEGKKIVVHCLAGLGRTGMFLACLAKKRFGYSGHEAIEWIRDKIPGAVENPDQEAFVMAY